MLNVMAMQDPQIEDAFLASPSDLMKVLAHLADASPRHSRQHRQDRDSARIALAQLLPAISTADLQTTSPEGSNRTNGDASESAPWPAIELTNRTQRIDQSFPPPDGTSRIRRRQFCECKQCKWCLDNARWERVFEEKFADPAYYGPIRIRHNSSLAGGL